MGDDGVADEQRGTIHWTWLTTGVPTCRPPFPRIALPEPEGMGERGLEALTHWIGRHSEDRACPLMSFYDAFALALGLGLADRELALRMYAALNLTDAEREEIRDGLDEIWHAAHRL